MSRASKVLTLFLFECALLGGAFAGGYYRQRQLIEDCRAGSAVQDKTHRTMQAWQQVMGAEVGAMAGNYDYALERTASASAATASAGLKLEKDFAEINDLLRTHNPLSRERLLALADKLIPGALGQPGGKLLLGAATPAPQGIPAPQQAQAAAPAPAPQGIPAPAPAHEDPVAAGPTSKTSAAPGTDEGHKALLDAKVSLLSGGDQAATLRQIALAQTLLDDAGHTEFDDLLGTAMKALRDKDEARARSSIESVLTRLRAP